MGNDGSLIFDTKIDDSGFKKGMASLGSLGTSALKGVGIALGVATAAMTALGVSAIKTGMDFSAQMSRVQAISGATADELRALNKVAIKLGASTSFSASEAAAGMENLASAGFDANEIMSAMPGLLDLAAVSGGNVAAASEVAATALRAFGLEASEAGHVADVFAAAAAATNAEALDMGEAMKYVAPVAKAMGQSLEETAAAIGIMSDAGIKGGQAGTALRGALSRLAKPTRIMKASIKELGISFYDTEGNMLPLNKMVGVLQESMEGLTQEQKNQHLVTLFGQESLSGMLALIEAGPEKLNELTGSLENSDGAAADMAVTIMDNLKGAIEEMGGAFETFKITLFQKFEEPLKDLAKTATDVMNYLTMAFGGKDEMIASMEEMGLSAYDLGIDLESIPSGFTGLLEKAKEILKGFAENLIAQLPTILNTGREILASLIQGITERLPELIPMAQGLIQSMVDGMATYMPIMLNSGAQILTGLIQGITEMLPTLITQAIDLIILYADTLIANLPMVISAGLGLIKALAQGIIDNLPKLIAEVPRIINSFAGAIYDMLPVILGTGLSIIWELIKGLIGAIPTIIANLPQIIMAIVNVFTLYNWWNLGKTILTNLGQGIVSMKGSIVTWVKGIGANIVESIRYLLSGGSIRMIGLNFIQTIGTGIKSLATAPVTMIKTIGTNVINAIKSIFSAKSWTIGSDLVKGIWNGISNVTGWILSKIRGFGSSIIKGIKSIFGIASPSTVLRDEVGEMLPPGIGDGVENAMPALQKDVDREMSGLTAKMKATVYAETADVGAKMTAGSSTHKAPTTAADEAAAKKKDDEGMLHATIIMDHRAVAEVITPYTSNEAAKNRKRRDK